MNFSVGNVWPSGSALSWRQSIWLTHPVGRVINFLSAKCSFLCGCGRTWLSEPSRPVKTFSG